MHKESLRINTHAYIHTKILYISQKTYLEKAAY